MCFISRGETGRDLNYERDILSAIDWHQLGLEAPVNLGEEAQLQEIRATIHLQDEAVIDKKLQGSAAHNLEVAFFVRRLGDVLPNPWHASRIVKATLTAYREEGIDEETLYTHRLYLSEYLKRCLRDRIEKLSEDVFREKLEAGKIQFNLQADGALNYQMEKTLVVSLAPEARPMMHPHGEMLQQNLFEQVFEAEFNKFGNRFRALFGQTECYSVVAPHRREAGVFLARLATRPCLSGFYRLPPTESNRTATTLHL